MNRKLFYFLPIYLAMICITRQPVFSQQKKDSLNTPQPLPATNNPVSKPIDTTRHRRSDASKAALRSAILPGLGQAYNRKYWKIPIVYGALAIPAYTFVYNKTWYDKTRYAYTVKSTNDTANFDNIDPELQPLSTSSLRVYRDEFRQNMDFSVLAFILIWGLNVADAAVDGHLKGFTVSDDLSVKINPGFTPMGMTQTVSLVFCIGNHAPRTVTQTR
jgi:hypothetical protein